MNMYLRYIKRLLHKTDPRQAQTVIDACSEEEDFKQNKDKSATVNLRRACYLF